MRKFGTLIAGAGLIASCVRSNPEVSPVFPTPFPEIATTPELETWVTSRILSFRERQVSEGFIGLGLQVLAPTAALESAEAHIASLTVTSLEPPPGWFVSPLGKEPVVIVVNADNQLGDLSSDEIVGIFTGRIENWQMLGGPDRAIQPVIPLEGAETRNYLQHFVLGDRRFTSSALLGPGPQAMLELVQEDLGAIGILPLSTVTADVGLLTIDGQESGQTGEYPWILEVLAVAPEEPQGIVREWLAWLQAAGE
ncbi:MAG: substrate-binding domain-containing protein [Anaerolineales bacterium]